MTADPKPPPDRTKPRPGDGVYRYETTKGTLFGYVLSLPRRPDGTRDQRRRQGFATKKAAREARAKETTERRAGAWVEPSTETVAAYLARWLEASRPGWRGSSYHAFEKAVRLRIVPVLGGVRLDRLATPAVQGWVGGMVAAGRSPRTVRFAHAALRMALARAVAWGLLARNAASGVALPALPEPAPRAWSASQARAFLAAVEGHRLAPLWRLCLDAGLRPGEALALRGADLDLDAGVVAVRRTLTEDADGRVVLGTAPKTRAGRRAVPLGPATVAALRTVPPPADAAGLFFARPDGSPLPATSTRAALRAAALRAGVPPIGPHGLRHSCASMLLEAGAHPKAVSERLGHGSIAITMDLYSHPTPRLQRDATEALARLLDAPPVTPE